ncbi:hypothetical protein [Nocardia cyriacigeorgica]|uniref:hypothetical protein n=1 Tax=Nocardia cyriacigeorgica TaxID=135487 RepID=UPI001F2E0843|nr:hypothetical protein [Nocardia cyriacigeorgica]
MRARPTALAWIDSEISTAPEWDAAQVQRLARRLGFDLVFPAERSALPLAEQVRSADVDAVIVAASNHIDPLTMDAIMHLCDVEFVCPRMSFARWTVVGRERRSRVRYRARAAPRGDRGCGVVASGARSAVR